MDVCLWVLKESNKSRFDSYNVSNSVSIVSHITLRDCRVHSFSDNLSRNSCIHTDGEVLSCSFPIGWDWSSHDNRDIFTCEGWKLYLHWTPNFCRWKNPGILSVSIMINIFIHTWLNKTLSLETYAKLKVFLLKLVIHYHELLVLMPCHSGEV